MDNFPPGTRVAIHEGDRYRYGTVQGTETVENMQVAIVKLDGGDIAKIPINALTRAG
ncbi:uncharacterized protein LAESUDRAFT_720510 [Laetiporus sulphureus 93-53]|uniref:Hypervirulence associated protein TUDOR domain-containing protein n=1 Tax=Laetiporus sulphureus 93-53 TaxID=1314785 RepID=A0A165H643_9APHY|nr:uncharacterized protein LAESUDRAFT_720510 [Laetiporus sulphureus 93-53]KZT11295.1 hypothetical protein LAESUDRAFT_720510 [Laetiporus sulphureus 93-53]